MTAKNKETLLEIQQMIEKFMEERGLKLSDEKTVITKIEDGFDFLGWNFRKFKGKLLIQPSKKSKQKVIKSLSRTIKYYHEASQELLIIKLNQITRGWRSIITVFAQRKPMPSLTTGCGKCCGNGQREGIPARAKNGLRTDTGIPRGIGSGHSGRIK